MWKKKKMGVCFLCWKKYWKDLLKGLAQCFEFLQRVLSSLSFLHSSADLSHLPAPKWEKLKPKSGPTGTEMCLTEQGTTCKSFARLRKVSGNDFLKNYKWRPQQNQFIWNKCEQLDWRNQTFVDKTRHEIITQVCLAGNEGVAQSRNLTETWNSQHSFQMIKCWFCH